MIEHWRKICCDVLKHGYWNVQTKPLNKPHVFLNQDTLKVLALTVFFSYLNIQTSTEWIKWLLCKCWSCCRPLTLTLYTRWSAWQSFKQQQVQVNAVAQSHFISCTMHSGTCRQRISLWCNRKDQTPVGETVCLSVSLTRPVERTVLVGVQSDHLANGPHVVSQHDALSLHHEEVGVGCQQDREKGFNMHEIWLSNLRL